MLREDSLKTSIAALSDSSSSNASGSKPLSAMPSFQSPLSTVQQSPPSLGPHFSRPAASRGEASSSSSSPSGHHGDERRSFYLDSAARAAEFGNEEDDWGFNLDDILAGENEIPRPHSPYPPQLPEPPWPNSSKPPQSCTSETPQPYNSEPVDCLVMPNTAASSPYHSAQTSNLPSVSSKKPFRPPFLQPNTQGLNTSFGKTFGKPSMFKPSGTNEPPQDDAAEFRGQYEHKREMYKIFNQVR